MMIERRVIVMRNRQSSIVHRQLLAAAGLLLCAVVAGQTEQNADLKKIRSRISSLQGKLAESEKHVATLSEEINRLDLKLEIAQKEAELIVATREDFARQLTVTRAERAVSVESSQRLARALVARARVLHRFGRLYEQGRREVARMATLRRERETLLAREKSATTSRRDEVMALSEKATRLERLLQRLAQASAAQASDPSGGVRP